jgi:hypothetical protein
MPTVSTVTSCPSADFVPTEILVGPVKLARSSSLCVLTKAIPDSNGKLSKIAPVALSYDGRAWERAAGEFAMKLLYGQELGDYPGEGSQLTRPDLNNTGKYYLTSYPRRTISEADKVARFFEAVTFGTTAAELASFGTLMADTAKRWIIDQMNMNLTSHREYFRKRANPRVRYICNLILRFLVCCTSLSDVIFARFVVISLPTQWDRTQRSSMRSRFKMEKIRFFQEGGRKWCSCCSAVRSNEKKTQLTPTLPLS